MRGTRGCLSVSVRVGIIALHPHKKKLIGVNQFLNFELVSSSNVHIIDTYCFTSADEFDYFYEFVDDGKVVYAAEQPINTNDILEIPTFDDTKGEVYLNPFNEKSEKIFDNIVVTVY